MIKQPHAINQEMRHINAAQKELKIIDPAYQAQQELVNKETKKLEKLGRHRASLISTIEST